MIGFTPAQVDECSFWQFGACVKGFNKANNPDEGNPAPTNEEFDRLLSRLDKIKDREKMH